MVAVIRSVFDIPTRNSTSRSAASQGSILNVVLPNQIYYFEVGKGQWGGVFDFRITDQQAYRRASIGGVNRLLVSALRFVITVLGKPSISSKITVNETQGPAGYRMEHLHSFKVGRDFMFVQRHLPA